LDMLPLFFQVMLTSLVLALGWDYSL
jgi:hypothetical protein